MKTKEEILKNHAEQKYIFGDGMTHKQSLILLNSIYMAMDEYASQLQQEWIPVEVRLPEEGEVHVTIMDDGIPKVKTDWYNENLKRWINYSDVIAWKPKPQPYNPKQS